MVLPPVIHKTQRRSNPADPAFDQGPFQFGKAGRSATPNNLLEGLVHLKLHNADDDTTGTRTVGATKRVAPANVNTGNQVHVLERGPQRVPVGQIIRTVVHPGRQHDTDVTQPGAAFRFRNGPFNRTPTRHHAHSFETIGIGRTIFRQPVVIRPAAGVQVFGIRRTHQRQPHPGIDDLPGHPIHVLVFQPFMRVPASRTIIRIPKALGGRDIHTLGLEVLHRPLKGQRARSQAVNDNIIPALVQGLNARRFIPPLFIHPGQPQVCRLHNMRVG